MKSTWMMMGLGCAMSGCSHGTPMGGMDVPPPELVQLVVDADRNGVADRHVSHTTIASSPHEGHSPPAHKVSVRPVPASSLR